MPATTCTDRSFPDWTQSRIVCFERPSAAAASSRRTQRAGASGTSRPFQLVGHSDAPWCGWHDLARLHEALACPAADRVGADAEFICSRIDVLPLRTLLEGSGTWSRAGNAQSRSEWPNATFGERVALAGAQAPGVEDERDLLVRVMRTQAPHEVQHLCRRNASMLPDPVQARREARDGATNPRDREICNCTFPIGGDDLLDQAPKELLTIAVRGRGRAPQGSSESSI